MNEAVHPLEAQRLAVLQLRSPAGACNERDRVGFGTRHVCVDVRLVAQFLYQVDLSCDSVSGSDHLELLGPNSYCDRSQTGRGDCRHLLAVQRNLDVAETHPTRTDRRRYQVHTWRSDEACNKRIGRPIVKFGRRSELLQLAALEHCHAITHRHRFHLIVRDVDGGGSETTLQRRDLRAGLDA